ELLPLAPRAGIEARIVPAGADEVENLDGRAHSGTAVDGDLIRSEYALGKRRSVRRVSRARDAARDLVDRVRLAAVALGDARVEDQQARIADPCRQLVGRDRVVLAFTRDERLWLDRLVAVRERAAPAVEVEHRAVVVTEVTQ